MSAHNMKSLPLQGETQDETTRTVFVIRIVLQNFWISQGLSDLTHQNSPLHHLINSMLGELETTRCNFSCDRVLDQIHGFTF